MNELIKRKKKPYTFLRLGVSEEKRSRKTNMVKLLKEVRNLGVAVEVETHALKQKKGVLANNAKRVSKMFRRFWYIRESLIIERRKQGFLTEECLLTKTVRHLFETHERILRHYLIPLMPRRSSEDCNSLEHYRCKLAALDSLPLLPVKTYFKCKSFENRLLELSLLPTAGRLYAQLKQMLAKLTFSKNEYLYTAGKKALAIVAGSYPAHLAKVLDGYQDVDVFVLISNRETDLLSLFTSQGVRWMPNYGQWNQNSIVSVGDYGKVQLIFKYIGQEPCMCDEHIDQNVFEGFHHCTRWRLDVFKGFFLTRYIYAGWNNEREKIVAHKSSMDMTVRKTKLVGRSGHPNIVHFSVEQCDRIYPQKHYENILDWGPPSLVEQSLRCYLKHCC
jgi:hypothetical protein